MGEYWEPRLPKLMLSLEDESRLCKKNEKQKGDKQPIAINYRLNPPPPPDNMELLFSY